MISIRPTGISNARLPQRSKATESSERTICEALPRKVPSAKAQMTSGLILEVVCCAPKALVCCAEQSVTLSYVS